MPQHKISVIIPAFNEESIIESTTTEVVDYLEKKLPETYIWELILVNDGSKDNTGQLMEKLAVAINNVKTVHHPTNFGRGKAIKSGFLRASGEVLICLDADLSYSPDHILKMLQKQRETNADIVIASCYKKGGRVENVPSYRAFLSRIGNKLFSIAFQNQITTATCIVRAYKADIIKSMDLASDGKDLHPEILFKSVLIGLKIEEIPATLKWRDHKYNKNPIQKKRKSKFKLSKTANTHLFLLLWTRPFLLFLIPGIFLLSIGFIQSLFLAFDFIKIYIDLRELIPSLKKVLSDSQFAVVFCSITFIFGFQVFSLGFISMLAQRNFAELYRLLHRSLRSKKD